MEEPPWYNSGMCLHPSILWPRSPTASPMLPGPLTPFCQCEQSRGLHPLDFVIRKSDSSQGSKTIITRVLNKLLQSSQACYLRQRGPEIKVILGFSELCLEEMNKEPNLSLNLSLLRKGHQDFLGRTGQTQVL